MTTLGFITNPILRGFNPDPSILRIGRDFYIANSTFEWFPGCQIHHSTDLVNWQLITRPLNRPSQLNLLGVPDSCGVWAPCLSFKAGVFYLVFNNVRSFSSRWIDSPNYVVTATDIHGPWSEPIYLNSSGFDASLFHDDDGRSYLLNVLLDHRNNRLFGGIIMQEFDTSTSQLVGDIHYLFKGTEHGSTEGPHLYKRNHYYYLLVAEGGTGYNHCVTMLRSRSITGPYELHPQNPIITARDHNENYLQKTGHADLVYTPDDEWYMVFLCSRPLPETRRCTLGRETAIMAVEWRDDWLYPTCENKLPARLTPIPSFASDTEHHISHSRLIEFSATQDLDINLQSLRQPISDDWASLTARPGYLRLTGRDSLNSTFQQSLVAHRLQSHHAIVSTCVIFEPDNFQQMAGLACYYNAGHYHYLAIRGDDFCHQSDRKILTIISCDNLTIEQQADEIELTDVTRVWLKADFDHDRIQFYYATLENDWKRFGSALDGSILSDDYVAHEENGFQPCFTGAFFALCCQDLSGQNAFADFQWMNYQEIE